MIIPVDYAQANLRFTGPGMPLGGEVTLGLNIELFVGDPQDLAEQVFDSFGPVATGTSISSSVSLTSCYVKYGPNATGPSAVDSGSFTGTGGSGTSPNVSYLIRKNTSFGGRTGRGRMYWPGVVESGPGSDGVIDSAVVSNLQGNINSAYTTLVSIGAIPHLLHSAGSPISAPLPITSFTVDGKVATQRDRLRR